MSGKPAIKRWDTLVTMFFDQVEANGDKPMLHWKTSDGWQALTWNEVSEKVQRLAKALRVMGVEAGDRVVLVSENRPEWLIADMAIMTAGAISVPSYTTYTARDYLHICENSGARAAIVSTRALAKTFLKAAHESDELIDVIVMEDPKIEQSLNLNIHHWGDALATLAEQFADMDLPALPEPNRDDIACLIYTSGTGGAPKGVKTHHGAILHNCEGAARVIEELGLKDNSFLSFLPLSHSYEHSAGQFLPISIGASIWYAEGLEKLASNMGEASPTVMVVVPRLFEVLRTKLTRQMAASGGLKEKLFNHAITLGTKRLLEPEKLTILDRLANVFLDKTVRKQVRNKFGGRLKALVAGGAPLSPDVGYFFASLNLPLLQGYGQTESGPVVSVNPPSAPRMHTVGKILENTDVKIAEDGEILIRGELVMKGYWRDVHTTDRTIIDGWLHTGDIGAFDDEQYLMITDRKKDIIVNDKGDNVSPQRVEGMLALEDEVAQAMVFGDRRPYLVGLIVPDDEWIRDWAKKNDKPNDYEALKNDTDFNKAIKDAVARVNSRLATVEKIKRFTLADDHFSVDNEQMTPTMKIRRHVINDKYRDRLEDLY